jgi:hypothetical protein
MTATAIQILEIIRDYHNYNGFQFTTKHIIDWAGQFEENDRAFILEEFLFLLQRGIYISEADARRILVESIESLSREYKYKSVPEFLENVDFLRLQKDHKSQGVLLSIMDQELKNRYNKGLAECGNVSGKHCLYIDDILATGGTLYNDMNTWLPQTNAAGSSNLDLIIKNEKTLKIVLLCFHNANTTLWRLKVGLNRDEVLKKITFIYAYEIQNHLGFMNQRLNFAFPLAEESEEVASYWNQLFQDDPGTKAFRRIGTPAVETLFSSPANRIKFENIILKKGIEILLNSKTLKPNHRPLGATFPSYKTLGTGTLFFTWRNISNTCPVVFWWKSDIWNPLFPLNNRGGLSI